MDAQIRDLLRRDAAAVTLPSGDWDRLSRRLWPEPRWRRVGKLVFLFSILVAFLAG